MAPQRWLRSSGQLARRRLSGASVRTRAPDSGLAGWRTRQRCIAPLRPGLGTGPPQRRCRGPGRGGGLAARHDAPRRTQRSTDHGARRRQPARALASAHPVLRAAAEHGYPPAGIEAQPRAVDLVVSNQRTDDRTPLRPAGTELVIRAGVQDTQRALVLIRRVGSVQLQDRMMPLADELVRTPPRPVRLHDARHTAATMLK